MNSEPAAEKQVFSMRNWMAKAANNGNVLAQRGLGIISNHTDKKTGLKWLRKSAAKGDLESQGVGLIQLKAFSPLQSTGLIVGV